MVIKVWAFPNKMHSQDLFNMQNADFSKENRSVLDGNLDVELESKCCSYTNPHYVAGN